MACVLFNIPCPSAWVVSSGPYWEARSHYLDRDVTTQSLSQSYRDTLGFAHTHTPGSINRNAAFICGLNAYGEAGSEA